MSEEAVIKDPVCGKPVDPLRARAVGIFGGVTQYFCSPECKARFADPRRVDSGPSIDGVERRLDNSEASSEWFARTPRPSSVDRFTDLESGAPEKPVPPSPSLLVDVATTRSRAWIWVAAGLVVLVALVVLGLRR